VLTGYLDDGTAGLAAIKIQGGLAVVQDPDEAQAPSMPRSALRYVQVDHRLPLSQIAPLLVRLAAEQTIPETQGVKEHIDERLMSPEEMIGKFGPPTAFVCPECHGSLWETTTGRALQFRCHVGHLYSPESLLADHKEGSEDGLWSVVRTLDEQAALLRRLAQRETQLPTLEAEFQNRARHCEKQAQLIRTLIQDK
jgi:two-component system chemotaxis response regulator CheB